MHHKIVVKIRRISTKMRRKSLMKQIAKGGDAGGGLAAALAQLEGQNDERAKKRLQHDHGDAPAHAVSNQGGPAVFDQHQKLKDKLQVVTKEVMMLKGLVKELEGENDTIEGENTNMRKSVTRTVLKADRDAAKKKKRRGTKKKGTKKKDRWKKAKMASSLHHAAATMAKSAKKAAEKRESRRPSRRAAKGGAEEDVFGD